MKLTQALLLSFVIGSQALPQSPNAHHLRRNVYPSTAGCKAWHSEDEARQLWDDSLAGVIGDEFIEKHGVANWLQNLDKEIFQEPSNSWYCYDQNTRCEVDKTCGKLSTKFMFPAGCAEVLC